MLFIKTLCVLLISASVVFLGLKKANLLYMRLKNLRETRGVMASLFRQMFYFKEEIGEALKIVKSQNGSHMAECMLSLFDGRDILPKSLNFRDREIISQVVTSLGMGEATEQSRRGEELIKNIDEQINEAKQEFYSNAKVYSAVSLCIGVCIGLIII